MTRADLTDITFVLDRSGSMESIKDATISSFNEFVRSQQTGDGTARLSLIQFDDRYEPLYQATDVRAVPELTPMTFQPRGSTALLDAIGRTIITTGRRLRWLREAQRPANVLFVTLTDGFENSSRQFTARKINQMIGEQRDKYAWQFLFLGANQDAIATAAQLGVGADQAITFSASSSGTMGCMDALNNKLHQWRKARIQPGSPADFAFDESDRAKARGSMD